MALPERQIYDDDHSEQPVTRPKLGVIDGGGESTERKSGHLKSVTDDPERIKQKEEGGEKATGANRAESKEAGLLPGARMLPGGENDSGGWTTQLKNKSGRRFFANITRRKAFVTGSAAGGIIGIVFLMVSFLQGPLQFVHFAQLLEQFHFGDSQDFMDGRIGKLIQYARTTDATQNRNMSTAGNKIADVYEAKLRRAGMEPVYDQRTRRISSLEIDTNTAEGKKAIKEIERHGTSISIDESGKATVNLEGSSARARRRAISAMVSAMGMGKVSGSLGARVLKIRAGVDFHPLKNIARAADERARLGFDKWREEKLDERNKSIQEGTKTQDADVAKSGSTDPDNPDNPTDAAEADKAVTESNAIMDEATKPNTDINTRIEGVRGAINKGVGVTAVVGLVCGIQKIGTESAIIQESNVIKPLIRVGMNVVTTGGQVMSNKDVSMEELGVIAESFYSEEDGSWMDAKSIQAEMGVEQTGKDIPDAARPGKDKPGFFKAIDEVVGFIPGGEQACSAVTSTVGGIAMTVAGIAASATGVFSVVASGLSEVVQDRIAAQIIPGIVRWLAGEAVDLTSAKGGVFGSIANYGAFLANNNQMMSMGGIPQTPAAVSQLREEREIKIRDEMQHKDWYARYLDMSEPNSLAAKSILSNPHLASTGSALGYIGSFPSRSLGSLTGSITNLFPHAKAAPTPFDYGVDAYGYSLPEIDSDEHADPYEIANRVEPKIDALNEKYGDCFGSTVDSSGKLTIKESKSYVELNTMGQCQDPNNAELTDYRFYLADTMGAKTLLCYEAEDEDACSQIGAGQSTPGNNNPTTPVLNGVECPANMTETKQVGGTTYYKLPPAPGGEYTIYSRDARRYGQKDLICVLYTVAKAYKAMYGPRSTMDIGDLNAAGHKSHKWGVAVDLDAQGEVVAADNVNSPKKYSTEATIALGKLFVDTGYIKNIWYCSNDGATEAIKGYAASVGKPINMKCLPGHYNHFHVDINTPRGPEDTP